MKKQQSGFTLIELIAVIVILGILAATAVPRFVDLSNAAERAAVSGVAGALGSAAALNHANNIADDAGLVLAGEPQPVEVTDCDDVGPLLDGGMPTGYTITSLAVGAAEGDSVSCTVSNANSITATFPAYNVQN